MLPVASIEEDPELKRRARAAHALLYTPPADLYGEASWARAAVLFSQGCGDGNSGGERFRECLLLALETTSSPWRILTASDRYLYERMAAILSDPVREVSTVVLLSIAVGQVIDGVSAAELFPVVRHLLGGTQLGPDDDVFASVAGQQARAKLLEQHPAFAQVNAEVLRAARAAGDWDAVDRWVADTVAVLGSESFPIALSAAPNIEGCKHTMPDPHIIEALRLYNPVELEQLGHALEALRQNSGCTSTDPFEVVRQSNAKLWAWTGAANLKALRDLAGEFERWAVNARTEAREGGALGRPDLSLGKADAFDRCGVMLRACISNIEGCTHAAPDTTSDSTPITTLAGFIAALPPDAAKMQERFPKLKIGVQSTGLVPGILVSGTAHHGWLELRKSRGQPWRVCGSVGAGTSGVGTLDHAQAIAVDLLDVVSALRLGEELLAGVRIP